MKHTTTRRVASTLFAAVGLLAAGHSAAHTHRAPPTHAIPDPGPVTAAEAQSLVHGNNAFALQMYNRISAQTGNLAFSPASISLAAGMLHAGARGQTAAQIAHALHFELDSARLEPAMAQWQRTLTTPQGAHAPEIRVANRIWGRSGTTFLPAFVADTGRYFGAPFVAADFAAHPDAARRSINGWVAAQTHDRIRDLFAPGDVHADTQLVLANAVYFLGTWSHGFDAAQTHPLPFSTAAGGRAQVPTMSQTEQFAYADAGTVKVLEMPYRDSTLAMDIVLPTAPDGLAAVEHDLTDANLARWLGTLHSAEVRVLLPRFRTTTSVALNSSLQSMGMTDAFSSGVADFTGIAPRPTALFVTAAVHQAFVSVDEHGTEAAAATGFGVETTSVPPPPVEFRADHPFLFVIRDTGTQQILFMGRVADPS